MKSYIAINASSLIKRDKTGVEWYSWQLLKYLAREWKETDPPVVLFAPSKPDNFSNFIYKNWRIKILPGKFLWTQCRLLKFIKRFPPALLFSPAYTAPCFLPKDIPTINVVHGLESERFPEFSTLKQIISDNFLVIPAIKKSTRIIAVSEHTKNDLSHFYNLPLEQIETILSGPGTLDDDEINSLPTGKSTKIIKFLFLGGSRERKNLVTALKIFLAIREQSKRNIQLLIAGDINQANPAVKNIIKAESKNIRLLGYIPEAEKKKQLESAHFLLYPSFYEGFGFPVLEAQAFGAIPIVFPGSGLNEVGGKGIVELDPSLKNKSLGVKLRKIVENPAKIKSLRQFGLDNVKRYSWQKCAKEVRKVILNTI